MYHQKLINICLSTFGITLFDNICVLSRSHVDASVFKLEVLGKEMLCQLACGLGEVGSTWTGCRVLSGGPT